MYRGMTPAERDADRRRRLLDAGLELIGTRGYAATSITEVCRAARVTARAFYDHFPSREELLLAVYAEVIERHARAVLDALADHPDDPEARVRAGVAASVRGWLDDPRRARLAQLEVLGVSPVAERRRLEVIDGYVEIVAREARAIQHLLDEAEARRIAVALVGAVNESIVEWLIREPGRSSDPRAVIATLQRLFVSPLSDPRA